MTDLTPADLAKFIHRVPVGATIPADTEFAVGSSGAFTLVVIGRDFMQPQDALPRWTAEPLSAPDPSLAERARALLVEPTAKWSPTGVRLIHIVAELAEKVEAQS